MGFGDLIVEEIFGALWVVFRVMFGLVIGLFRGVAKSKEPDDWNAEEGRRD